MKETAASEKEDWPGKAFGALKRIDRIWVTAMVVFIIAFWLAMILSVREYAIFKSNVRAYFLNPNEETDYAITVLLDGRLVRVFGLYTAVLIGLTPIILHRLTKRLWIGLVAVGVLFLPSCWYGGQVNYVSGKFIDWTALISDFEDLPAEDDPGSDPQ